MGENWKEHVKAANTAWDDNAETMLPYLRGAMATIRDMGITDEDMLRTGWIVGFACCLSEFKRLGAKAEVTP